MTLLLWLRFVLLAGFAAIVGFYLWEAYQGRD
jgi:hypothetical protein